METRVIKTYKTCELCGGRGLETIEGYDTDCRECEGYGKVIVRKEVQVDE